MSWYFLNLSAQRLFLIKNKIQNYKGENQQCWLHKIALSNFIYEDTKQDFKD